MLNMDTRVADASQEIAESLGAGNHTISLPTGNGRMTSYKVTYANPAEIGDGWSHTGRDIVMYTRGDTVEVHTTERYSRPVRGLAARLGLRRDTEQRNELTVETHRV